MKRHFKNWLQLLLLIMLVCCLAILSGCSASRHMTKSSDKTEFEDKSVTKENSGHTTQSITTETTTSQTTVTDPADTICGSKPTNDVTRSQPFILESAGSKVTIWNENGNINAQLETKERQHEVGQTTTKTTIQKVADTTSKEVHNDINKNEDHASKEVKTKGQPWAQSVVCGVVVLLLLAFLLSRKKITGFLKKIKSFIS